MSAVPSFVLVAGVNGCGKSTFAKRAEGSDLLLGQSAINPDILSQQALAQSPKLNSVGGNLAGAERAEKAVWRAVAEGRSVAVETVLSTDKFIPVVEAARFRGFRTRLIFVALPTVEDALARIAARVQDGGHAVPEESVRRRWRAAHDNLIVFLELVNDLLIFSNAGSVPILVAERKERTREIHLLQPDALPEVTKRLRT